MTPRLEIKNVSKIFKKKVALMPFTLQVSPGECIALCGGNGAGKSTLLHILAGISSPSAGTVLINHEDLLKNRMKYVSFIGYMPDEFSAQETLTVFEFLQFYARFRNASDNRIIEILRILGLEDKKQVQLKHLSKGMRQRLLFGQAWIGNPQVLLLDEPTNGLDPYWIDVFIQLLKEIRNSGTSIIYSTHMMDVAAETADRIIFMENGKLAACLQNSHQDPNKFMLDLLHLYRKQKSQQSM